MVYTLNSVGVLENKAQKLCVIILTKQATSDIELYVSKAKPWLKVSMPTLSLGITA